MGRSFSDTQLRIFRDRYALRNPDDPTKTIEDSPEEMWKRVAKWAASPEEDSAIWEGKFLEILEDWRFVPGGRILHAAGAGARVTALNCYVIPSPEDSRQGILHSLGEWVETQAKGGGVGINMSSLRPKGAVVHGVHGTSSGPVPWMELFTTATKDVIQQGGSRRGAAMIMLSDSHPDILEFIEAKKTAGRLEGANLTVALTDRFMEAVEGDEDWRLLWGGKTYRTIKARELWSLLIDAAWESGEPGCFWIERANKNRNLWYLPEMKFLCTNPCAEIPLPAYGACLLGTINIHAFVRDDHIDWEDMKETVRRAVRFLDNVTDLSFYPLPEFKRHQEGVRQQGLGATGVADALIELCEPYGSKDSVALIEEIYKNNAIAAYEASIDLAQERGMFPLCDPEKHADAPFVQKLPEHIAPLIRKHGIRNSYLMAQQPSGTQSLLAGVNSGIEPVFDFGAIRKDRTGTYKPTGAAVDRYRSVMKMAQVTSSQNGEAPVPGYFITANDLTPEQHVDVQAAAQRWVDQSISKTVNAPSTHTKEGVRELYEYAYQQGLRTVAYYRDNSRQEQVLTRQDAELVAAPPKRVKLPVTRESVTHRFQVGEHEGYLNVGRYGDGSPGEVFVTMSKEGSTIRGLMDAFATAISINLQYGVPIDYLVKKFSGSNFEPAGMTQNPEIPLVTSVLDYIFRWIGQNYAEDVARTGSRGLVCPDCGNIMMVAEGCDRCGACGYSKCH